jgi:Tfp pilus assembly protein PilX
MGTALDYRRWAEQCIAMARLSENSQDKALWLTLAQSWVRLAEHVARAETDLVRVACDGEEAVTPEVYWP